MAKGRVIRQDQLDRLFTAALEAAIGRVEKDGYFHPLVFELRDNGAIQAIVLLETGEVDDERGPVERLFDLLRPRAQCGTIYGAAIALLHSSPAVLEVQVRAANYSSDIRVPFTMEATGVFKRKRRINLGEFSHRPARNNLFGTPT